MLIWSLRMEICAKFESELLGIIQKTNEINRLEIMHLQEKLFGIFLLSQNPCGWQINALEGLFARSALESSIAAMSIFIVTSEEY